MSAGCGTRWPCRGGDVSARPARTAGSYRMFRRKARYWKTGSTASVTWLLLNRLPLGVVT